MITSLPPLSLYIHIPWCIRKCPYCDFNSHEPSDALPEVDYVAALRADLQADALLAQGRPFQSVFFGGGTPSLLSARAVGQILEHVDALVGLAPEAEITLEANPGTFEQARFRDYRTAGVNRLSIGVQSFHSERLQQLGRIHGREEALAAVTMARQAGFDNLNLDLMHGLPDQTTQQACADLQQAIDLAPEHISWYQLTIEPNTQFYSAPPLLPVEDTLADIQAKGEHLLAESGYQQYEVSAYARAGLKARHNLNYWEYGDYLGIGAGAHGKVTWPGGSGITRLWKTRLPKHYLERQESDGINSQSAHQNHNNPFLAGTEVISPKALPLDFLINALRLNEGVAPEIFIARTGLELEALEPQWSQLKQQGLISDLDSRMVTTDLGRRFLNEVLARF